MRQSPNENRRSENTHLYSRHTQPEDGRMRAICGFVAKATCLRVVCRDQTLTSDQSLSLPPQPKQKLRRQGVNRCDFANATEKKCIGISSVVRSTLHSPAGSNARLHKGNISIRCSTETVQYIRRQRRTHWGTPEIAGDCIIPLACQRPVGHLADQGSTSVHRCPRCVIEICTQVASA